MSERRVRVAPIPRWVDHARLLGPTGTEQPWVVHEPLIEEGGPRVAEATLSSELAADLGARLRGIGIDGSALACTIEPPLRRATVRDARTADAQRRRSTTPGFERAGTRVDEEGRWSLTPERLALAIARAAKRAPIVDAGCGVGGNAIGFARAGCRVVAIEADRDRLELAKHNAGIYQVGHLIRFVHGDATILAPELADPRTILFVDPPWGTDKRDRYGLADLPVLAALWPIGGSYGVWAEVWAKLPPSFATAELAPARSEAVFGEAEGDLRRIKFVLAKSASRHS